MPNIAVILRQEIQRLARRETRIQTQSLRRAAAQWRKDIAELKRQASRLQADVASLERQAPKNVLPKVTEADAEGVRFKAQGVTAQRRRLGLSAASYAKLVGVTAHTIYKWEHGAARPRKRQLAALASLRSLGKREAYARLEQLGAKAAKGRKKEA
jgi:DNA-binding transcriptional regulator YiaG